MKIVILFYGLQLVSWFLVITLQSYITHDEILVHSIVSSFVGEWYVSSSMINYT